MFSFAASCYFLLCSYTRLASRCPLNAPLCCQFTSPPTPSPSVSLSRRSCRHQWTETPPHIPALPLWMKLVVGLLLLDMVAANPDPLTMSCNGLKGERTKDLAILAMISNCFPHILILTEKWQGPDQPLHMPLDPMHQFDLRRFYNVYFEHLPVRQSVEWLYW